MAAPELATALMCAEPYTPSSARPTWPPVCAGAGRQLVGLAPGRADTLTTVQTVTGISLVIMTGLDPEGCEGCRTILNESGYTVVDVTSPGDGTSTIKLAT